jgi:hypothetical protein
MLTYNAVKTFSVTLKIIPTRLWSSEALSTKVNLLSLPSICGRLDVDLEIIPTLKGAFKTAHHGSITPNNGVLPLPLSGDVCVKQVYFSGPGGTIKRHPPAEEQSYIHSEVGCLDWARILLDLTYEFIKDLEEEGLRHFPGIIPKLRFVEAALVECDTGKCFLIEEWINTSKAPFTKYINNARAVSCIPQRAPEELQNIAKFLCFSQHVQYQVTSGTLFTSDYQGMSQILRVGICS